MPQHLGSERPGFLGFKCRPRGGLGYTLAVIYFHAQVLRVTLREALRRN